MKGTRVISIYRTPHWDIRTCLNALQKVSTLGIEAHFCTSGSRGVIGEVLKLLLVHPCWLSNLSRAQEAHFFQQIHETYVENRQNIGLLLRSRLLPTQSIRSILRSGSLLHINGPFSRAYFAPSSARVVCRLLL